MQNFSSIQFPINYPLSIPATFNFNVLLYWVVDVPIVVVSNIIMYDQTESHTQYIGKHDNGMISFRIFFP